MEWEEQSAQVNVSQSSVSKESACDAGNPGSIPGSGRSPGEEIGYPLQYSWASLVVQLIKNRPQCGRPGFDPWRLPTPVFWPGEFHRLYSGLIILYCTHAFLLSPVQLYFYQVIVVLLRHVYMFCCREANSDSMLELFLWLAFCCFCHYNYTEQPASESCPSAWL